MTNSDYLRQCSARPEWARRNFADFVLYSMPAYSMEWFHRDICNRLQQVERGQIKKLMIFMPPQHGKTELATRHFSPFVLGRQPDKKIAVVSYSATIAQGFNRDMQRVIDNERYHEVFPGTTLNESNVVTHAKGNYLRNAEQFEVVGYKGFVKTVGVGGSLTSTPVDLGVIDDPIKDMEQAQSATYRDKVWDWYVNVFKTRLHNDSQQLIILTRWNIDDLAGRILSKEDDWTIVRYEALRDRFDNPIDPRSKGEALWPHRHSRERIEAVRDESPITFNALYQQDPKPSTESLVFPSWKVSDYWPIEQSIYGLDFGYSNDPTALIEMRVQGQNVYLREHIYRTKMLNSDIIDYLEANDIKGPIIADSAEPKSIQEIANGGDKGGINIVGAKKGRDSVNYGINILNKFNVYYSPNCSNIQREANMYSYMMAGGYATNQPIDTYNHAIDAIRYAAMSKLNNKQFWVV